VRFVPYVCGTHDDDGIYVSTAKALAEGNGYRLINLPGAPIQTKYPILYPLLVSIVWRIYPSYPDNLLVIQLLSILCAITVVAVTYLYLVRFGHASRRVAACACLLGSTSQWHAYYGTLAMSEMPFALVTLSAMWSCEVYARSAGRSRLKQAGVGTLVALPFLSRTIGIVMVVALPWLYLRARRRSGLALLAVLVLCVPWLVYMRFGYLAWQGDAVTAYYTDYLSWWAANRPVIAIIVSVNSALTLLYTGFAGAEGVVTLLRPFIPISLPFMLLGVLTWRVVIKRAVTGSLAALYVLTYGILMVCWPWSPDRFIAPIMLFLITYGIIGAQGALQWLLPNRRVNRIGLVLVLICAMANLGLLATYGMRSMTDGFPYRTLSLPRVKWSGFQETFGWLRANTIPSSVVAGNLDSMIYLYTGRQAYRPLLVQPTSLFYGAKVDVALRATELVDNLQRHHASYLMLSPGGVHVDELLRATALVQRQRPGMLQRVFIGTDPRFVVFAVRRLPAY
jgi:hypothetical protein